MTTEGDVWRQVRAEVKAKRRQNAAAYLELLSRSGIPFEITNQGQTLVFRQHVGNPILFWPSTGKWRVSEPHAKTFNGGARAFLSW